MAKQVYWLSDAEWRRIEPLMPRGRQGAHRVDDRRVISGIIHMLRSGARWRDCPRSLRALHDDLQPLQSLEPTGDLDGHFLRADRIDRHVRIDVGGFHATSKPIAPRPAQKGGLQQCDRPLARRADHQNPRADRRYRPSACLPDHAGNIHDLSDARGLLGMVRGPRRLLADRAYDATACATNWPHDGIKAVIPPNPTRKHPHRYDKTAYKGRNVIERMFCRLKDFRRIATRYDKRADIYLSAILLAAAITWWIN